MTLKLELDDVSAAKITALRKKASALGLSPEAYIKQLIEDDLALDQQARSRSFAEISSPIRSALRGMSGRQLDELSRRRKSNRRSASPS